MVLGGINGLFSTALSGLKAADAIVNTAASNLANLDSAGYKSRRANLAAAPGGGVAVQSVTADPSPGPVDDEGREGSNVDPVREIVNLKLGKALYDANAAVVRVGVDLTGTLLDMLDDGRHGRLRP